jgi:transposase
MRYIGIDISKATLDWAAVDAAEGRLVAEQSATNTASGIADLVAHLQTLTPELLVLEATGAYHLPLLSALVAAELPVTLINPTQLVAFRQIRLGRTKTDRQDARVLARFGATYAAELRRFVPRSPLQEALRAWMRYRETLVLQQTQLRGHQEANHWHGDPQVQQWLATRAEALQTHLAEVDAAIADLLAQLPEAAVVQDIIGVGPRVAAAVLGALPVALWGDAKTAAAFFGLVPRLAQSGTRSRSWMSKTGPGSVRRILYMAARVAITHDPAIAAWYQAMVDRGKPKRVAQCAVMHKLLRHMMGRLNAWYRTQQTQPTA